MDGGFGGGGSDGSSQGGGGGGYSGGSVIGYQFPPVVSGGSGSYIPRNHGNTFNGETGGCDKGDGCVTVRFNGP